ncbi:MAG: hypothetical protein WC683_10290 [bacterium]
MWAVLIIIAALVVLGAQTAAATPGDLIAKLTAGMGYFFCAFVVGLIATIQASKTTRE